MTALLSRKRSRIDSDDENDYDHPGLYHTSTTHSKNGASIEHRELAPSPSPTSSMPAPASLKRNKTQGELEELDIVPADEAWAIDIESILASPRVNTFTCGGQARESHSNLGRYVKGGSIVVLCVQGNVQVHYDLLWSVIIFPLSRVFEEE